jgi:hypothetical protein
MNRFVLSVSLIAALAATLIALTPAAHAQLFRSRSRCVGGSCYASEQPAAETSVTAAAADDGHVTGAVLVGKDGLNYRWHSWQARPNRRYLFVGNKLIGYYDTEKGFYYRAIGEDYSEPETAPVSPITGDVERLSFGVQSDKMGRGESYSLNGKPISRAQAIEAIEGDNSQIPDDEAQPSVTVIARDKAVRAQAKKDFDSRPAGDTPYKFQVYDPDSFVSREILRPFNLDGDPEFRKAGVVTIAQASPRSANPNKTAVIYDYDGPQTVQEGLQGIGAAPRKPWSRFDENTVLAIAGVFVALMFLVLLVAVAVRASRRDD